jgi:hypothetical protein
MLSPGAANSRMALNLSRWVAGTVPLMPLVGVEGGLWVAIEDRFLLSGYCLFSGADAPRTRILCSCCLLLLYKKVVWGYLTTYEQKASAKTVNA